MIYFLVAYQTLQISSFCSISCNFIRKAPNLLPHAIAKLRQTYTHVCKPTLLFHFFSLFSFLVYSLQRINTLFLFFCWNLEKCKIFSLMLTFPRKTLVTFLRFDQAFVLQSLIKVIFWGL